MKIRWCVVTRKQLLTLLNLLFTRKLTFILDDIKNRKSAHQINYKDLKCPFESEASIKPVSKLVDASIH